MLGFPDAKSTVASSADLRPDFQLGQDSDSRHGLSLGRYRRIAPSGGRAAPPSPARGRSDSQLPNQRLY
jgi:hypothetical protein